MAEVPENPNSAEELDDLQSQNAPVGEDALRAMMQQYFIDWASYVVKDRAIPDVDDGLKPVQRRILYTLSTMDDGRFHKVTEVQGQTMKYHPHGDASIKDALVVLANKGYFIDRQGNFGNIITGDPAAAGRYIECRLAKFAREVLFNNAITEFVDSYDGRGKEPVALPAKVPALLMMGSDGIAVGMATHIFPHNFGELLEAEIAILENRPFQVLPDFQTGGLMDASEYDDGHGLIRVRAKIETEGDKRVIIRELPAETTTERLIASIEKAARSGKLKIASIADLTSGDVNIEIALNRGVYAEETVQALYAYTECQKTIRSNLLVIRDNLPAEMGVGEILHRNVAKLQEQLDQELQLKQHAELEQLQRLSLERIFIENRIYKAIEKCSTMPRIMSAVHKGLAPFREQLVRDVTDEDVNHLLQIPIRRISLFDLNKNLDDIEAVKKALDQTRYDLAHQVEYAIAFLRRILEEYGPLYPRRTTITSFSDVDRKEIALRNVKVYHDRVNYFIGTSVKASSKDAEPLVCTEFDRLMVLRTDGTCMVIPIEAKTYIGQTKYVFVYDKEQVFCILYHDKKTGTWYAKRFQLGNYILKKEYHVVPEGCVIDALYTNSGVVVSLELPVSRRRAQSSIEVDFDSFPLRGREARGFKITSYSVLKISVVKRGGGVAPPESPEKPEPPESPEPPEKPTPPEKPEPPEPPEKPESPESPEKPAPPESPEKPESPEPPKNGKKRTKALHQDELPFFLDE
ncbi:MAG: DNA topoisomerase IV subunit A [Victivallales bacterium]|nr:DNA topoisomerase IV subunit A [Victivallales bacterium]